MQRNQLQSAPTLQPQIGWGKKKKKRGSADESERRLQWKALLKVNLTLNWLFYSGRGGQREEVRGADSEGEKWRGRAAHQDLALSGADVWRWAVLPHRWHDESRKQSARAQNEDKDQNAETAHRRFNRGTVHTHTHTHTDPHTRSKQVIRQLAAAKVGEGCCPEISETAADPPNMIITEIQRVKATGKRKISTDQCRRHSSESRRRYTRR